MVSNYFTLYHIAHQLNQNFSGKQIAEIYSQERNTLVLVVESNTLYTIKISCEGSSNYISCKDGDHRARKNSVDLFPVLVGKKIEHVFIHPHDRILCIKCEAQQFVIIELFRAKANVILCNEHGIILDAFLNKKDFLGKPYALFPSAQITIESIIGSKESFVKNISASEFISVLLKQLIPVAGPILIKEILFRAVLSEKTHGNILSLSQQEIVFTVTKNSIKQLLDCSNNVTPIIYSEEKLPVCFSLIPLQQFSELEQQVFPSLFDGIQAYVGRTKSVKSFTEKKKEVSAWLEKELAKALQTLTKVRKEFDDSSRTEQYELFGTLIKNNLHIVRKGMKSIQLEPSYSNEETVTIPLDGSLSPIQNAERYFGKSKKAKQAKEESHQRIVYLEQRIQHFSRLIEEFNEIESGISLKNFLHVQYNSLHSLGYMTAKEHEDLPPFKIFTVEGGFTVYAGKSSENNDTLTVKFAKPNDLWFHARGSSGSHVILRMGSGNGEPSKKAIEQAASIAAYYSKMKNARNVPVAMTEKKYVRKPKGVPAGTVVIEREKVIFVEPKLPDA